VAAPRAVPVATGTVAAVGAAAAGVGPVVRVVVLEVAVAVGDQVSHAAVGPLAAVVRVASPLPATPRAGPSPSRSPRATKRR
jgi:hypothetical protein